MPAFGDYQSLSTVDLGENATIYSAVSPSKQGGQKFAIKVGRIPGIESKAAAYEAARVQKTAGDSGGRHLAPILDMGITDDGLPWYVTRLYDSSLAKFLKHNVADAALLYRIVDDVLSGLEEFQNANHRSHGNLKPSNILLDGTDPRRLRAFLADPAAEPQEVTLAGDLFELGRIVYQLVRRAPKLPALHPPLEMTSDWNDYGSKWLDFTNRLLNQTANAAPDALRVLRGQLPGLRRPSTVKRTERQKIGVFWKIAAAVLVMAAVGFGVEQYFEAHHSPVERPLAQEELQHAQAALAFCRDPRSTKLLNDDYLAENLFQNLQNAEPDRKFIDRFLKAMGGWPPRKHVEEACQKYESLHWDLAVALREKCPEELNFDHLQSQLDNTLEAEGEVELVNGEWKVMENLFQEWNDAGEADLKPLERWENGKMSARKDLVSAAAEIENDRQNLQRISGERLSRKRFSSALAETQRIASSDELLREAQRYRPVDDPAILVALRNREAGVRASLKNLPKDQLTGAEADLTKVDSYIEDPVLKDIEMDGGGIAVTLAKLEALAAKYAPVTKPVNSPFVANNRSSGSTGPGNVIPPSPILTPLPDPAIAENAALRKWLMELQGAAPKYTTVKDFYPMFVTATNADLAEVGRQPNPQRLIQELSSLLQAKPAPLPALNDAWAKEIDGTTDPNPFAIYRHTASGYLVPFVLIRPAGGKPFYMAGIELPAGLAVKMDASIRANAQPNGPQVWPPTVPGVLPWQWKAGTIGLTKQALSLPTAPSFYAPGVIPEKITAYTPLNSISARAAKSLADRLKCRLPTFEEWRASQSRASQITPRLRGGQWLKQFKYWQDLRTRFARSPSGDPGHSIPWPDDGSYTAGPDWGSGRDPAIASGPVDDTKLWFRSVPDFTQGADPRLIYDWEGNVAQFIENSPGAVSIIGGSAISDPNLWDKPQPAGSDLKTYSDVGVRLAANPAGDVPQGELAEFSKGVDKALAELGKPPAATP